MIRALRRRFVAANMALVSAVLAVVFACLLVSTAAAARQQTMDALSRAVQPGGPADHKPEIAPRGERMPGTPAGTAGPAVFWVLVDGAGTMLDCGTEQVDITEEVLAAVTAGALAAGQQTGTLKDPALRYLLQYSPDGILIAFADRSGEAATLHAQALRLLAVGVGALAAFFAVSLFLARLALRPVETAWAQQRRFVADASHELKTPLTVILTSADLLARHPEQTVAEQQKWLDAIREEGARMRRLVDDLLFLARADALRTPAPATRVDWSELTECAALAFEAVAFERGVSLHTKITPGLTVLGDPAQLRQLAGILLDNACKYAGGSKQVVLRLNAAQGSAVLQVCNTGPTLAPEELNHLFERFYRADNARTHGDGGGFGLGLSIARSIAEAHHGQIRAQSTAGETALTVTLPLEKG